jgi:hypothetical protein
MSPADLDFRDAFNCYLGGRINAFSSPTKLAPIVVNPRIPDHDVAIIATATGRVVATSAGMPEDPGTLNYGLAFDRRGRRLLLANTHARNDADFGHRPWRNRVTRFGVDRTTGALRWEGTSDLDLDPGQTEPTPASPSAGAGGSSRPRPATACWSSTTGVACCAGSTSASPLGACSAPRRGPPTC